MAITWLRLGFEKSQRSFLITYKTNVDKRSDVRRNTDWNFSPCYTTGNGTALVLVLVVLKTLMRSSEHKHIDGRQTDGKESSLRQTPLLSGRVNEHPCVENSKRPSLLPPPPTISISTVPQASFCCSSVLHFDQTSCHSAASADTALEQLIRI